MIGDLPSLTGFLRELPSTGSKATPSARPSARTESVTFTARLEKYLDDFRKGRALEYDSVPKELSQKSIVSANLLAQQNPKALELANAYSTGLRYDQKARFVSNVADAASRISQINDAQDPSAFQYSLTLLA